MTAPRLKKAILRPLAKVRMDVDAEGQITPVVVRLEPDGDPIVISRVDHIDDRITEVWFEVETRDGDRLVLRVEREKLRWELQTVESTNPDRYRGWFEAKQAAEAAAAGQDVAQSAQEAAQTTPGSEDGSAQQDGSHPEEGT